MLKPLCPHCHLPVSLLHDWPSRKGTKQYICANCKSPIQVNFRGSTYVAWFTVLAMVCAVGTWLLGTAILGPLWAAALLLPLIPSLYLESAA